MTAGFVPSEFWAQTPRSFVATMEGAARAAKRRQDEIIAGAWHMANFNAATKVGKLKKLSTYLEAGQPRKAQTAAEMLNVFRQFQARGAGMTIRKLN